MGDWGEDRSDGTREFRVIENRVNWFPLKREGELIAVNPLTHFVQNGIKIQYIVAIGLKWHVY